MARGRGRASDIARDRGMWTWEERQKIIEEAEKIIIERQEVMNPAEKVIGKTINRAELDAEPEERQEIMNPAEKIIGKTIDRAELDAELFRLDEMRAGRYLIRARGSKQAMQAVRRVYDALRRLKAAMSQLPEDFKLLFGGDEMLRQLEVYEAVLGKEVVATGKLQEQLDAKSGQPKPAAIEIKRSRRKRTADDKRLAAELALRLCELHNIEPTTTKTGKFVKLAAVLYGDSGADLQHQCRDLVVERKNGAK
jgi:hypothetical protein